MEHLENMDWEEITPPANSEHEIKEIMKSLRKRNWKIVLTSVVLVIALLIGTVYWGIPALERQYWDPTISTYIEGISDTELTMATFCELFGQGKRVFDVKITQTGFANYSLNTVFLDWTNRTKLTSLYSRTTQIEAGQHNMDQVFWLDYKYANFLPPDKEIKDPNVKNYIYRHNREVQEKLAKLPEYIDVRATISFKEYMSPHRFNTWTSQFSEADANFIWAAFQTAEPQANWPVMGMHLYPTANDKFESAQWKDSAYPHLFIGNYFTFDDLPEHVTSMLRFSADQVKKGTGILPDDCEPDYYEKTLQFVEENGVNIYGCIVITTPQTLLDMFDKGIISEIWLDDAYIHY